MESAERAKPIGAVELAEALRSDVRHYETHVRDLVGRMHQYLVLAITATAAAVPVLYESHLYAALLAVPLVGSIGILLGASISTDLFASAAHGHVAAESLYKLLRESTPRDRAGLLPIPWDAAGPVTRNSVGNWGLQVVYILVFLAATVSALVLAYQNLPGQRVLVWVFLAVTPLLLGMCAVGCVQSLRTYDRTMRGLRAFQAAASEPPVSRSSR